MEINNFLLLYVKLAQISFKGTWANNNIEHFCNFPDTKPQPAESHCYDLQASAGQNPLPQEEKSTSSLSPSLHLEPSLCHTVCIKANKPHDNSFPPYPILLSHLLLWPINIVKVKNLAGKEV